MCQLREFQLKGMIILMTLEFLNISNDVNYIDISSDFAYVYETIVSDESILGNCLIVFTNEGKITSFIEELDSNYDNYGIIVIELMSDSTGVVSYVDGELANLFDVNSNVNIVE